MKENQISFLTAQIKILPIFICAVCSKQKTGDTMRIDFRAFTSEHLKNQVDNISLSSHDMPVGWSYNGKFTCEKCH